LGPRSCGVGVSDVTVIVNENRVREIDLILE
jgi:hypothetical protein